MKKKVFSCIVCSKKSYDYEFKYVHKVGNRFRRDCPKCGGFNGMVTGPAMPKQYVTLEEYELAKSVLILYKAIEEEGKGLTSKPATRALHKIQNNTCLS